MDITPCLLPTSYSRVPLPLPLPQMNIITALPVFTSSNKARTTQTTNNPGPTSTAEKVSLPITNKYEPQHSMKHNTPKSEVFP